MQNYLDINYLKSLNKEPKYFGLGFIQMKLNDVERLHFWHPDLSSMMPDEEVHNHRYTFTSTVLLGSLLHANYDFIESSFGEYERHYVSCKPNELAPLDITIGDILVSGVYSLEKGSSYIFPYTCFHKIHAEKAITHVIRNEIVSEYAQVIRPKNSSAVCPFSKKIPTEQLWKYIEDLIGDKSGYHTTEIEKGVYGEISKISEEVAELIDARKQSSSIMELVELSDLYGAIEAVVAKYHGKTMNDLKIMSDITKRAFTNGHR